MGLLALEPGRKCWVAWRMESCSSRWAHWAAWAARTSEALWGRPSCAQGKLQHYWGQDPRLELVESSKVLPYRAEPLYDLARYHSAMSATPGCPPSPLPGATPLNETCALMHIAAAFHYARRAAALPLPSAVSHP